jgi:hypothetical protein
MLRRVRIRGSDRRIDRAGSPGERGVSPRRLRSVSGSSGRAVSGRGRGGVAVGCRGTMGCGKRSRDIQDVVGCWRSWSRSTSSCQAGVAARLSLRAPLGSAGTRQHSYGLWRVKRRGSRPAVLRVGFGEGSAPAVVDVVVATHIRGLVPHDRVCEMRSGAVLSRRAWPGWAAHSVLSGRSSRRVAGALSSPSR